jgi:hypothetical protein
MDFIHTNTAWRSGWSHLFAIWLILLLLLSQSADRKQDGIDIRAVGRDNATSDEDLFELKVGNSIFSITNTGFADSFNSYELQKESNCKKWIKSSQNN